MIKSELLEALAPYPDDAAVVVANPDGADVTDLDYVAPYPSDSHGVDFNDSGKVGEEEVSDIVLWPKWSES
jgi:hypothetical protein